MTNIFSIVADQKQVVISVNSIWFTGFAIIACGLVLYKFLVWIDQGNNDNEFNVVHQAFEVTHHTATKE